MSLLDYFRTPKKNTASLAKERLQIIVAHERSQRNTPNYLPQMQKEILAVISKYVDINKEDVKVNLDKNDRFSVLELNVTLPDEDSQIR